ncbi:hypothetical protein [Collibacillus ludicampi]|nr:hypothetical protein [Collibacillus ludicampi]
MRRRSEERAGIMIARVDGKRIDSVLFANLRERRGRMSAYT